MTVILKVYQCIATVAAELAKTGISKDDYNQGQKYKFRGVDTVMNTLAPLLVGAKLVVVPNVIERTVTERETKAGGVLFFTTVKVEYSFIAVEDGSCVIASTYGEAMDSGDKSTNKAMSAAYKYCMFQTFCIPTEGDNDADATTHQVAAKPKQLSREEQLQRWSEWADEQRKIIADYTLYAQMEDWIKGQQGKYLTNLLNFDKALYSAMSKFIEQRSEELRVE